MESDEPYRSGSVGAVGAVGAVEGNEGNIVVGSGPTQTGSGMQHVGDVALSASGTVVYQVGPQATLYINRSLETARRRVRHRDVSDETVRRLRSRFIRPRGFAEALDVLLQHHVVLLDGEVDGGRRCTAVALLDSVPPSSAPARIWDLDPDAPDDDRSFLGDFELQTGDRLRLDLVGVDSAPLSQRLDALDAFWPVLQQYDAYLVVVLGSDGAFAVPTELRFLQASLGRPEPKDVLAAHLKADGLPAGLGAVSGDGKLADALANASLDRVARYADEIRRLVASDRSVSVDEALDRSRWVLVRDHELDMRKIIEARDPREKALMLSVAMLEGSAADAVCAAEERLVKLVEYPAGEEHWIARAGLGSRLAEVNAQWDAQGLVHFRRPGYGAAVRTVFWDDFPERRDLLCAWVAGIPGRPGAGRAGLAPADCIRLADRFAEQALRTHRPDHVTWLVGNWADRSTTNARLAAAASALALGVTDPAHGWRVREKTYEWSRQADLADPLAQILVRVCLGVLKVDRPMVAMRRLHNLTHHKSSNIAGTAVDELVDWASRDARVRRELMMRFARPPGWWRRSPRDASLFLRLAHLVLADVRAGDTELGAALDAGCRAALDAADRDELAVWVERQLDTAANSANGTHGDDLRPVDLLDWVVDACRGRLDLLSRLRRHLAACAAEPDEREGRQSREAREARCHVQARVEQHLSIGGAPGRRQTSAPPPKADESGALP